MPESSLQWWARRQRVTGLTVPYEAGRFSTFWSGYRRVLAVYEPERNHGLLLSQVPLAADVYLVFGCFLGHEWVATPQEQRDRSGRDRRGRDTTCPECSRRTLMAGPSRYAAPDGSAAEAERADARSASDERAETQRREVAAAAASAAGAGVWRVPAAAAGDPPRSAGIDPRTTEPGASARSGPVPMAGSSGPLDQVPADGVMDPVRAAGLSGPLDPGPAGGVVDPVRTAGSRDLLDPGSAGGVVDPARTAALSGSLDQVPTAGSADPLRAAGGAGSPTAPRASGRLGDPLRPPRRAGAKHAPPVPGGPAGEAFVDPKAFRLGTSAAEGELRRRLAEVLEQNLELNAVRVAQPFHGRLHVWPDVILPDLRIALEWDTTGRIGDEHVGHRERSDRLKDRLLRRVGWEVVRLRGEGLRPIGPYDLDARGVSGALVERILDRCCEIRGELFVAAYRR
ncbi:MAG: hypothetical protein ABW204_05700 [Microbacteriaceae bacterium]